ncbi:cobalt ABC transporter ATP-binding protein [Xaviernesmea oryzae]|uniref:Cobalt ABC transporter ATP-binding protein n=1 Tax=Xaviernesmea oryzae TaxID=464029 RepID=A0A1Q9ATQ9_9HYPH|nr:ABC transporter ATP-binding protein [Xaviernesmea oryzae]OLP58803.1 cobalt ABC transporter ATP-binding protein [Xaviernesmea oryzae]
MDIRFSACSLSYGERRVLEPLTLDLKEERIGIIGLNGSGKSSFARLINGLQVPSSGMVTVNGIDTAADPAAAAREAGFIFQSPQNQVILPVVADDIALGLTSRGIGKAQAAEQVGAILRRFGIEALARRRVHELSGGELQLVALASVLVTEPSLVIFDEPTNQLDLRNRRKVADAIHGLDRPAIVVSHDLALIADFPRVLLFHEGRLIADGAAAGVIRAYEQVAA